MKLAIANTKSLNYIFFRIKMNFLCKISHKNLYKIILENYEFKTKNSLKEILK